MNNTKRILIIAFAVVLLCASLCVTASANYDDDRRYRVYVTHADGSVDMLIDVDRSLFESVDLNSFILAPGMEVPSTFSYADKTMTEDLPNPNAIARLIDGLSEVAYDMSLPLCANFVLIDYGPDWKVAAENNQGNTPITGQYAYIFWGEWSATYADVIAGQGHHLPADSHYMYYDEELQDECSHYFYGPVAYVSYDVDSGTATINSNTYTVKKDANRLGSELTIENLNSTGLSTVSGGNCRAITFSMNGVSSFSIGATNFVRSDIYEYTWNEDWDGDFDVGGIADLDFWDYITNGYFTESDNPIVNFFMRALQGLSEVVQFVQDIPEFFSEFVGVLPPKFVIFLEVCLASIFTVLVIKFALHVLR